MTEQTDEPPATFDTPALVGIAASALSAAFLADAVFGTKDIGRSVIALIGAGIAAGLAAMAVWASGRAAERRNTRRHQEAMFKRTSEMYKSALARNGNDSGAGTVLPDLVTQSLSLVKRLPEDDHVKLVTESMAQHRELVSEWLEWNRQVGKEADANHTRLVLEWVQLIKEIASTPESTPAK